MKQASWLLIDFDGVLGERSQNRSEMVSTRLGLDRNIVRDFYTQGYKDIPQLATEAWAIKSTGDEVEFYFRVFSELARTNHVNQTSDYLRGLSQDFVSVPFRIISGVKEALELLSNHYKLGIFSNAHATRRQGELTYLGIIPLFDIIFISGELGYDKSSPKFYGKAITETGVEARNIRLIDNEIEQLKMAKNCGFGDGLLIAQESSSNWDSYPSLLDLATQLTLKRT